MKRFVLAGIYLLMFVSPLFSFDEYEYKIQVKKHISDTLALVTAADYRFGNTGLTYKHHDLRVGGRAYGWKLAFAYRAAYKIGDLVELEHRPYIQAETIFPTDVANFKIRSRQEFRIFENTTTSLRHRCRLHVSPPNKLYGLKPFISHEIFYDFSDNMIAIHRFQTGLKVTFAPFKPEIYYKHVLKQGDSSWEAKHSLVTKASLSF